MALAVSQLIVNLHQVKLCDFDTEIMKKLLFVLLISAGVLSCSTKENYDVEPGNPDLEITPDEVEPGDATGIDPKMFDLLNLDFPGLERVKELYGLGDLYNATVELIKYYRGRQIINPDLNMLEVNPTTQQISLADQATKEGEYRFKIAKFTDPSTGKYYSFLNPTTKALDWTIVPSELVGDNEFAYQLHRHQWMATQAMVYHATKEEKYVQAWIEIYFDWLKNFPCPEGKTSDKIWSGLQPCSRIDAQLDIFPYYIHSENFTPAVLSEFLVAFQVHMDNILNNFYYIEESNIRISQELVVFLAGIMMPEFKDAGQWYELGKTAVVSQVDKQFRPDGGHIELTFGYHIGVIDDFYVAYKTAYMNGLFSDFPSNYLDGLRKAAGFVADVMYPNYSLEVINDTFADSYTKKILMSNLSKYSEIFPDDAKIKWLATDGALGTKPNSTLITYPESGYYIMRNGWTPESTMLIHKNSTADTKWAHNHADNGHISLYVNGRRFLPDAGSYSYSQGEGGDDTGYLAVRKTSAHNTLTKDGVDKVEKRAGKLLTSVTLPEFELVVTENEAYSDLTHRRAIFFVDRKFYVVVDEAYGSNAGKVNLNFNLWGGQGDAPKSPVSGIPYTEIDEYPDNAKGAHSTFTDNNNIILKTYSETSDDLALNPSDSFYSDAYLIKTECKRYEVSVTKKADRAARFVTVIYPFGSKDSFAEQNISATFTDNPDPANAGTFHGDDGASVKVSINGKDYSLSYNLN